MVASQNTLDSAKLVAFDLDGTLIRPASSWRYLHEKLGTLKKAEMNSNLFYAGRTTWREWAERDAKLWAGTSMEEIRRIVQECPLMPGARETLSRLREKGLHTAIISGGVSFFADRVAEELRISHSFANKVHARNGILTGKVSVLVSPSDKPRLLHRLLKLFKLGMDDVAAVGDDFSMIPLFKTVGLSIAFNPSSKEVEENADIVIRDMNLLHILSHIFSCGKTADHDINSPI